MKEVLVYGETPLHCHVGAYIGGLKNGEQNVTINIGMCASKFFIGAFIFNI